MKRRRERTMAAEETNSPALRAIMASVEFLHAKFDRLEAAQTAERGADNSPWLRGDAEAMKFTKFKSRQAFRDWARTARVRPMPGGAKINLWERAELIKAMSRK
jgi:hypothetical protein